MLASAIGGWLRAVLLLSPITSAAELQPAALYTRPPQTESVIPSPSGDRVALLMRGAQGRLQLGITDASGRGAIKIIAAYSDGDVRRVRWVNDNRLVYEAFEAGPRIEKNGAGTMAVDHDGSNARPLIAWRWSNWETGTSITSRVLTYGWFLLDTVDDGSADVLVYHRETRSGADQFTLSRLNTLTGERRNLSYGLPAGTAQWVLDDKHEPRVVWARAGDRVTIHWRPPSSEEWKQLESFDRFAEDEGFSPVMIDRGGRLLAVARIQRDAAALHEYDVKNGRLNPEPLVAVRGFDLDPTAEIDSRSGAVVGVHFEADRPYSHWFDDRLRSVQRMVDVALPGRTNRIRCGRCETTRHFVVHSSSDQSPGEYFLLDHAEKRLTSLGKARPWIDETTQARRTFHRFTARDGMTIPVYVTHPAGAMPSDRLPAVVLVHGGPWVKGTNLLWHDDAQFLASRGYRVIEPEFRGSVGYGWRLQRAGWKQWGLAMQDDLADAVQWAAAQGTIDPARVCIMGSSYGGYAALMSPIRHPTTYRCAVSFAGVTDIGLMYSVHWSDISEESKRFGMPRMLGDPDADKGLLQAASPLQRVKELGVPVLLAHGGEDRRVTLDHARQFISAARAAGVTIEDVVYTNEGHGWFDPENQTDFYQRVERFLARALAAPVTEASR